MRHKCTHAHTHKERGGDHLAARFRVHRVGSAPGRHASGALLGGLRRRAPRTVARVGPRPGQLRLELPEVARDARRLRDLAVGVCPDLLGVPRQHRDAVEEVRKATARKEMLQVANLKGGNVQG